MPSPNPLRRGCKECKVKPFVPCKGQSGDFLRDCHESRKAPSRAPQKATRITDRHRISLWRGK